MRRPFAALCVLLLLAGTALGDPGTSDVGFVIQGNNAFAVDLYGRLRENDGNVVFSPYALSSSLALTSYGARGRTLDELTRTVRLLDQDRLHVAYLAFNQAVDRRTEKGRGYQMTFASDLRGGRATVFRQEFAELAASAYGSGPGRSNLTEVNKIRVVSRDAGGDEPEIKAIEPAGPDDPLPLTLTSVVRFKGRWATGFPAAETRSAAFTRADGSTVQAPLMHRSGRCAYAETEKLQILELPYADGGLRLVVLLPRTTALLPDVEKDLDLEKLPTTLNRVNPRTVDVTLPRCRVIGKMGLKKPLTQLGLGILFGAGADFSGLSDVKRTVCLADVVHWASVEFDEEGDGPAPRPGAADPEPGAPVVFKADRPFLFVIRDADNGSVLFLGRVADPTK